jgi:hypothetical protein
MTYEFETRSNNSHSFSRHQQMKPTRPIKTDSNGRAAYRLREASELTGIPTSTFRKKIRRGEINPITGFGVWLIAADDLEALLNKRLRNLKG